ncbi:MAG: hypothetical protein COU35_00095 [Candidatus Magasanikbacteria bacterium CG10_big_fil_rev_8_21_14_0_10_47_10]|uniref:Prepilin peptidase n=1 Tax=Candidatus Magasanikbacteria bacterium CG10_big_fil_rev_8_21_14_0_10_47_10 TaxID=1974652 RepID=A0A2H0TRS4_9BACT|nr:MAG: hypothetical protein COU35_00095 [Candidatus Magasanikbacteria bacterium CG10_big_fil_rev_8_21_14_0_10_47_10]
MVFVIAIIAGLLLGSFLNAWVWRTRHMFALSGRSVCPACVRVISWYDNIPIISYIVLAGNCRHCSSRIPLSYVFVEAWLPLAFVGTAVLSDSSSLTAALAFQWFIIFLLTFVFIYDAKYRLILDRATTIPAVILFGAFWYLGIHTPQTMLIGAVVGAGFFWFQYVLSQGRWIGGGDMRLGFFMGVVLGWPLILVALFLAYIVGAAVGVGMLALRKKDLQSATPFGTYLSAATLVTLLWGQRLLDWYMTFL